MDMTSGVFAASLLCSTCRALVLYSLWSALMPCRFSKPITYTTVWFIYISLDLSALKLASLGISPYFLFILHYAIVFLTAFFLYRGTSLARIVNIFVALGLFVMASPFVSVLLTLLPDRLQHILNYPTELLSVFSIDFLGYAFAIIGQSLLELLLTMAVVTLYKRIRFKEAFPSQAKFMIVPISQFLQVMAYIIFSFSNGMVVPQMDLYVLVIFLAAIVICIVADIFLFFTLRDMDKKAELELRLRLMEQSQLSDYMQYKTVDNLYRREREFRHDINNKLITAQSLLNQGANQELSHFLQEISGTVSGYKYAEYCENSLINTVLNNKIDMANASGIRVETEVLVGNLPLPGSDLCSLFSNILDNAVEACKKLPPDYEKCIRLTVRVQNNYLIVTCKNPAIHGPDSDTYTGVPYKKSPDRGWGLGILNRMAQQYDGELHTELLDNCFSLRIILKLDRAAH